VGAPSERRLRAIPSRLVRCLDHLDPVTLQVIGDKKVLWESKPIDTARTVEHARSMWRASMSWSCGSIVPVPVSTPTQSG
jgi:hypothetical protein